MPKEITVVVRINLHEHLVKRETCTCVCVCRFWDCSGGENYVLSLREHLQCSVGEVVSGITYNKDKCELGRPSDGHGYIVTHYSTILSHIEPPCR